MGKGSSGICVLGILGVYMIQGSYLWNMFNDGQLLSQNKVHISDCDVGYLIGDSAYPMENWLMKPFSDCGRLTPQQQKFSFRMSSARSVVDFFRFGRRLLKRND